MASLAQLKKKSGKNLKDLQEKLNQQSNGGQKRDERIWKPRLNQEKGKGTAIVRFLPAQEGEPFVEQMHYSFFGPGGNYYDLARQTVGEDDPIQIAAISAFRKAKAEGDKQLRERAIKWLPKRKYYANVYVIKDEENPDNEGNVFIWQFGPAIYNKLKTVINPEFDDEDPMDPFDLWAGADFRIRMVGKEIPDSRNPDKKVTVPDYDDSKFDNVSEFMDGDEDKLEEIFKKTYDLSEFVDPEKIKSFEEVAERFEKVMGYPYNWLSEGYTEQHAEKKEAEQKMDEEQDNDNGSEQYRDDEPDEKEEQGTGGFADDSEEDEDEDPVAKFKRLSGKS